MAKGVLRTDKKIIDEQFLNEWFAKLSQKRKQEITANRISENIGERKSPTSIFKQMEFIERIGWYFIYQ